MSAENTLGLALTARGERKGGVRVRANENIGTVLPLEAVENILAIDLATDQAAVGSKLKSRDLGLEVKVLGDESPDLVGELSGLLGRLVDDDEGSWPGDIKVNVLTYGLQLECLFQVNGSKLTVWGVRGVDDAEGGSGLENTKDGDDKVNTTMGIAPVRTLVSNAGHTNISDRDDEHDDISSLDARGDKMVCEEVRSLIDLAVGEFPAGGRRRSGLDDT